MSVISGRGPAYLRGVSLTSIDLSGAGWLAEADLRGADLSNANLKRANLRGANLEMANLHSANLTGTNFEGANLFRVKAEVANAAGDLREMQERLLEIAPDEVHLVLPAGLQRSLARGVVSAHLPLGVTHLLPTKLDEYPDERGLFELARQFALPMRWLADGQEVPRDLQVAPRTPGLRMPLALAAEGV